MRRRHCRKIAQKARRKFEAGKAVLSRGKVINRLVVTKIWVNGRASAHRDEWTEEVRAHCERCYDDKEEFPEVLVERIRRQRSSGDRRVAPQGRRVTITVDKVLWTRGKMLRNKANGPSDSLVTEMLRGNTLVRQALQRRMPWSRGVENSSPVFRKKPYAKLEKGLQRVLGDRTLECVLQVLHDRLGGHAHDEKKGAV